MPYKSSTVKFARFGYVVCLGLVLALAWPRISDPLVGALCALLTAIIVGFVETAIYFGEQL